MPSSDSSKTDTECEVHTNGVHCRCREAADELTREAEPLLELCTCGHLRQDHHALSEDAARCIGNRNLCPCDGFEPEGPPPDPEVGPPCSEIEGCDGKCCDSEDDLPAPCKGCGEPWRKGHECPAAEPPPPQPERRPPYAAAYSVQGHLYEVALPGDATVEAVDGALVVRHALGRVSGITAVNPIHQQNGHLA